MPCVVANARMIGATPTDPKTKAVSTYYEVACKGSMGFMLVDHGKGGDAPSWAACPDQAKVDPVSGKPNGAACFLPGNADNKAMLAPFVAKSGVPCDVTNVRGVGHSPKSAVLRGRLQQRPGLHRDHLVAAEPRPEGPADHLLRLRRDEPGGLHADRRPTR